MRPPRRKRVLSGEEARLWGEIAKLVIPLRGRAEPKPAAQTPVPQTPAEARRLSPAAPPRPAERPAPPLPSLPKGLSKELGRPLKLADLAPAPRPAAVPRPSAPAPVPQPPGAPGLERRERIGLKRGTLAIEARIDLHGLYQADAHAALVGFLLRARAEGHARVLVVTGKGSEESFAERGVLRRSVPHWLRGPELRGLVLGFEEAARHHGGAGALYVRLRRR